MKILAANRRIVMAAAPCLKVLLSYLTMHRAIWMCLHTGMDSSPTCAAPDPSQRPRTGADDGAIIIRAALTAKQRAGAATAIIYTAAEFTCRIRANGRNQRIAARPPDCSVVMHCPGAILTALRYTIHDLSWKKEKTVPWKYGIQ